MPVLPDKHQVQFSRLLDVSVPWSSGLELLLTDLRCTDGTFMQICELTCVPTKSAA
jgi:hypothetical protein